MTRIVVVLGVAHLVAIVIDSRIPRVSDFDFGISVLGLVSFTFTLNQWLIMVMLVVQNVINVLLPV